MSLKRIIYQTHLKEEEVIRRLEDFIHPEKQPGDTSFFSYPKTYKGEVDGSKFNIKRYLELRASFYPWIKGEIYQNNGNTIISAKMYLPTSAIVFCCILLIIIKDMIQYGFNPMIFVIIGGLFFYCLFVMLIIKSECNSCIKDLQELFEANIIQK